MKAFLIVMARLKSYYLTDKLIFSLFCFGSAACSLIAIFFFGNMNPSKTNSINNIQDGTEIHYKSYNISLDSPELIFESSLSALTKKYPVEHIMFTAALGRDSLSQNEGLALQEDAMYEVSACVFGKLEIPAAMGKVSISRDQSGAAAGPRDLCADLKKNNKLLIDGRKYELTGLAAGSTYEFYISGADFEAQKYKTNNVTVVTSEILSADAQQRLASDLKKIFPRSQMGGPWDYDKTEVNGMLTSVIMVCLVYFLSFLSFLFLMKYMVDKNSEENTIYAIIGARRPQVIKIMFIEGVVLSMGGYIVALIIHAVFYWRFFDKINFHKGIVYTAWDYLIVLLILTLTAALTNLPFVLSYRKNSLIAFRNKFT